MISGTDKRIRSLKENPAGKVIADAEGNRWQWDTNDETAVQLKKLSNDELEIERTDIHPRPPGKKKRAAAETPSGALWLRRWLLGSPPRSSRQARRDERDRDQQPERHQQKPDGQCVERAACSLRVATGEALRPGDGR
jgi:hypothetical protein